VADVAARSGAVAAVLAAMQAHADDADVAYSGSMALRIFVRRAPALACGTAGVLEAATRALRLALRLDLRVLVFSECQTVGYASCALTPGSSHAGLARRFC
jgi:hypothetical protein